MGKRISLRYAELPCGPHEVTAYEGDRLIGAVKPVEWNRPFDPDVNPLPVNPDDPFADHPLPTRSRYLEALTRKGEKRRKAQGGIRFRQLEEPRDV